MAGVRLEVMAFGWRFLWLKDVVVLQAIVTWSAAETQLFRKETDGHVGVWAGQIAVEMGRVPGGEDCGRHIWRGWSSLRWKLIWKAHQFRGVL
jgi:hypothetical protein